MHEAPKNRQGVKDTIKSWNQVYRDLAWAGTQGVGKWEAQAEPYISVQLAHEAGEVVVLERLG